MNLQTENKGKLEFLRDEFTDPDRQGWARIGHTLELINVADSVLQTHIDEAEQIIAKLVGREKSAALTLLSARKEAVVEIKSARESFVADAATIRSEFTKHGNALRALEGGLRGDLEKAHRDALAEITAQNEALTTQAESSTRTLGALAGNLREALTHEQQSVVAEIAEQHQAWTRDAESIDRSFHLHQTILETNAINLKKELDDQCRSIEKLFGEARDKAEAELSRLCDSSIVNIQVMLGNLEQGRAEFQRILGQIEYQRSGFQQEMAQARENVSLAQNEQQNKISAALKVADKLNNTSLYALKKINARSEKLHQREAALQKRTRQAVLGVGLAILATLGVWIWLALPHQ